MPNPMIRIHDSSTDQVLDREMTAQEFTEYKAQKATDEANQAEAADKLAAKQAVLLKLGLTAKEASALLA